MTMFGPPRQFVHGHPDVSALDVADAALAGGLDCTPPGVADTGAPRDVITDAYAAHRSGVESPWPPNVAPPTAPVVDHVNLRQPPFSSLDVAPVMHLAQHLTPPPAPGE